MPKTLLGKEAVRQLRAWLKDPRFEFGLPLAPAGTHFQRRVWQQIAAIPAGEVVTATATDLSTNNTSEFKRVTGLHLENWAT